MNFNTLMKTSMVFALAMVMATTVQARNFQPVDCDRGDSINDALAQRDFNEKLLIEISGTCNEDVLVKTDDAILTKDPDAFVPPKIKKITVDGARRVLLKDIDVSNDNGTGIVAKNNASLTVDTVNSEYNTENGMLIEKGAVADITNSNFTDNADEGIVAENRGTVTVEGGEISENTNSSVSARNNSLIKFTGVTTTVEGDINLFNNSSLEGAEFLEGNINADLASNVIGSSADEIIAERRSMVVDVPDGDTVVKLKTQSVGDVAVGFDECDSSSSVFDTSNIDPDLGCLKNDLDHFFNNIDVLHIGQDALESAVAFIEGVIDDILDTIEDLWDAINSLDF